MGTNRAARAPVRCWWRPPLVAASVFGYNCNGRSCRFPGRHTRTAVRAS